MVTNPEYIETSIRIFRDAAKANRELAARQGNVVELTLEHGDELMVSADLHGNRLNYNKLLEIAELRRRPRRHLIMQEVCHGGPHYPSSGGCMSHLLLEDVARLKADFPDRFHFLMSNHELAELTDFPITKSSRMLNLHFRSGMQELYGEQAEDVRLAALEFIGSLPLAVRVGNVFICHSIPERIEREPFDPEVFRRELTKQDLSAGGDAFRLVWGRDFRSSNAAEFCQLVDASVLIHGHEPCAEGSQVPNEYQVILDCCGLQACYAILPIGQELDQQEVVRRITRLYGAVSK